MIPGPTRGAIPADDAARPGTFRVADGATLFLDEIGELPLAMQPKLLRALQEGEIQPVGADTSAHVDVRILAATNRDLRAMVAAGQFREDLFYRINVINLVLPPLRERHDDVPLLVSAFLARHRGKSGKPKRLAPDCMVRMHEYPWPGNVRELENEIERLVVLGGDSALIGAHLLSPRIRLWAPTEATPAPDTGSLPAAVEALERKMIAAAMRRHGGNKTRAAEDLKVSRRNLIRLVQKYELEK